MLIFGKFLPRRNLLECLKFLVLTESRRHRRHRYSFGDEEEMTEISKSGSIKDIPINCEQACQAQFEADYQVIEEDGVKGQQHHQTNTEF